MHSQNKLTRVLKEINENHYDEYDRNLNNLSLFDLYTSFEQVFKDSDAAAREASNSKTFGKSDYKIYGPYESFEDAKKDWGDDSQDWCVFHRWDMYNTYTSAGQVFYVAAKNGWKSVPKRVGPDAPKDAYGNSLIAVSVNFHGILATSTPRWNHANGGGDNTYTVDELEELLQLPFYKTFLPSRRNVIAVWGPYDIVKVVESKGRIVYYIGSWTYPKSIFERDYFSLDGSTLTPLFTKPLQVWLDNKGTNILKPDGTLLLNTWYDEIGPYSEGYAPVKQNGKWNFIDENGDLISSNWYDGCFPSFFNGKARVRVNNEFVDINTKGEIVDSKRTYNLNCKKLLK